MTQMVNVLGVKTEIGSPMICSYLLGFPDHYTNKKFSTFYWKSFMAEAAGKWKGLEGHADKVKVSLKKRKGTIIGISPVEDYIHRPSELEDLALYDWMCTCERVANSSREAASSSDPVPFEDVMDEPAVFGDAVSPSVSHSLSPARSDARVDEAVVGAPTKSKARRSKYRRLQFVGDHPMCNSHHVRVAPDRDRKVPNFVGGMLPRKDKWDREYYCLTMLVFFQPWRSGTDLRRDAESTWDAEFGSYAFSEDHMRIMANFNLRYECLDARDD
ncbi:hypothetical protein EV421DRAFT_1718787, partial [Armillaria borealis]